MAGPAQDECAAAAQDTASSPRHAVAAPALAHAAAGCLAAQRAAGALAVRGGGPERPVAPGMPCHHQARVVADAAPTPAAPPDTMAAPGRPRRARAAAPPSCLRLPRHGCASRPEAGARCGSAARRALSWGLGNRHPYRDHIWDTHKRRMGIRDKTCRFNRIAENRRRCVEKTRTREQWGLKESADWWSAGQVSRQQIYGTATEMMPALVLRFINVCRVTQPKVRAEPSRRPLGLHHPGPSSPHRLRGA